MSDEEITQEKQWVTLRSGSMQAYVGHGNVANVAHELRCAVGKPHGLLLASVEETDEDLVESLRRDLLAEGFTVSLCGLPSGRGSCSIASVEGFWQELAEVGITSDDLVVAIGAAEALSVASFACSFWCGGTQLALIPTDLSSALVAGTTPLPLELPGVHRLVMQEGHARFLFCDLGLMDLDDSSESVLYARALMVAIAISDSDKAFGRLWDRSDDLAAGDLAVLATQVADTLKSRGRTVSSASAATRQSAEYGLTFAWAMRGLVPADVPFSTLLAEGMRFAARLSAGMDGLSVDDVLAQDEVLDRLGIGYVACEVNPDEMIAALKTECFRRSRRFMLCLPKALGRVRLSVVEDDLLAEHVGAWCDVHADLLTDDEADPAPEDAESALE
ncbi:MAG: 3-dehydroquinate synthase [Olsenella sp.]